MFWLSLALRNLRSNKGFSLFFVVNLALGLAGYISVQSFGQAIDRHLGENLKQILTADLVLSASAPMTEAEAALVERVLGPDKRSARLVAFYTMVRPEAAQKGPAPARLVRVMAMDRSYPLYGTFTLEKGTSPAVLHDRPGLFLTRDTALALGGRDNPDAPLKIGEKTFFIEDFFLEDPDKSLTAVDLAPKVYLGMDQLDGTGLVRFGSRILHLYFFAFPEGRDVPALAKKLSSALFDQSQGRPRINVVDSRDAGEQLGRLTQYVTGYMGLVSIVALFLAGISAAYLFRGAVAMKQKQMAILLATGAVRREIWFLFSLELLILGALAALLALGGALALMPAFPKIFKGLVPDGLSLALDPGTLVLALGLGTGGSLVFCLPVFVRLFKADPLALLQSHLGGQIAEWQGSGNRRSWVLALSFLPGVAAFFLVTMAAAARPWDGLIFGAGFALAMALLFAAGTLVFQACGRLAQSRRLYLPFRIAAQNLFRNRWSSLSSFVTIALGVFLICLIPQVQKGLEQEIMRPEGLKLPVFFLLDIQDAQTENLAQFMAGRPGELTHLSPMVQGRILSVNGSPFFEKEKMGKDGRKGRPGRIRGRRLEFVFSFRDRLADSETLVKGAPLPEEPWQFSSGLPFGVSVAQSFAERFDLKIGDLIGFDVQGISLTGKVVNLRKVRWNSFQPNFFLLFQDGVLNEAPKTYLGAISSVRPQDREPLKTALADRFPNVSVIDVTRTAATILGVADRLSLSVRFMAWLAIGAGLVSIFSIARHEARRNRHPFNLLKVLGLGGFSLQAVSLAEFGFIGLSASLFAAGLSVLFSVAISWYFFDNLWQLDLSYLLAILILATAVCTVTGMMAVRQVMKQSPATLLKAGE